MTCTSERSGIASTGVFHTEYMPHVTTKNVPSSTRKTCRTDHSIMLPTILVPAHSAGGGIVTECRPEVAFRVNQEIGFNHNPLPGLQSVCHFRVFIGTGAYFYRSRLKPALA